MPGLADLPVVATGVVGHGHVAVGLDHDGVIGRAVAVLIGERVGGAVRVGDDRGVVCAVVVGVVVGLAGVELALRGVDGDVLAARAAAAPAVPLLVVRAKAK